MTIPRWAIMWSLAVVIFFICKWITWKHPSTSLVRNVGYWLAWPGLDATSFLHGHVEKKPESSEWAFAASKLAVGLAIFYGVARRLPPDKPYWIGWAGMIGIVMILHFGLFHLLSCGWRQSGVVAKPLMNWPLVATGLSDFWGRRWNTAFRDLTHRTVFRMLTPRLGGRWALFAVFAFSGLIHDVVISVPAGGGYGGPTLFFLAQGAGIIVERSKPGQMTGLGSGWKGRLFVAWFLLAPVSILFHKPFVEEVVVPFMRAVRAI